MKFDVEIRVFYGPARQEAEKRKFDDVFVSVDAESGDEAAEKAVAKTKGERVAVKSVMPTPVVEEVAKPKRAAKK